MAAGKSTVAQALAEQFPQSVHLRGDLFRRMIVNGRAEMGFELTPEAQEQLELRYRIATEVAGIYLQSGFTVVYQDILIGKGLTEAVQRLRHHPLYVVVLCPSAEAVAEREASREKIGYGNLSITDFDRVLREETPRFGYWLDSSHQTGEQTVHDILANLINAHIAEHLHGER
ncbi:MAG: hypothetical protein OHK0029_19350 [Armatimonadaceae bacterium]